MKRVFLSACFAWTLTASAEPLYLEEVISSVVEHFPLVAAAAEDTRVAEADALSAEGAFDLRLRNRFSSNLSGYYPNQRFDSVLEKPTTLWGATVFGGYRLGTGSFPIYDDKQRTLAQGELRAGFEVPLWRDGPTDRRRANLSKSELSVGTANFQLEQQKIESVRQATHRYWAWVAAGRRVQVAKGLVQIAKERDSGLGERVKRGDVPAFERDDNMRTLFQRNAQLLSAERTLQQATIELSLFLRTPDGKTKIPEIARLPAELPLPAADELFSLPDLTAEALAKRPELERFRLQLKQNEIENDLAKNQLAPRVDLNFQVSRDLGSGDVTRERTEVEGGVLLEIPLERRLASGRVAAAGATESRLTALAGMTRDRIVADVKDAVLAIENARSRLNEIHKELQYARTLEEGERSRFRHGDSTVLFVNLREQATADTAVREVETLLEFHIAKANLTAALGRYQPNH